MLRVALCVALACLLSAGCGSDSNPFPPHATVVQHVNLVAITLPESLTAGELAPLTVQWYPRDCGEKFDRFAVTVDSSGGVMVEPWAVRPADGNYGCPATFTCQCSARTTLVRVPITGSVPLRVVGASGDISITLAAGVSAGGIEHVVELRRRDTSAPVAGATLIYRRPDLPNPIATAVTDSSGGAITTLACEPDSARSTYLLIEDDGWGCGFDVLEFGDDLRLCARALRTVMLYGPAPVAAP